MYAFSESFELESMICHIHSYTVNCFIVSILSHELTRVYEPNDNSNLSPFIFLSLEAVEKMLREESTNVGDKVHPGTTSGRTTESLAE